MYSRKLFIITGYNRVGKTTLARRLRAAFENHPDGGSDSFTTLPFGEYLKKELVKAGFSRDYLDRKTPKARRLMRSYGDAKREEEPFYFVDRWSDDAYLHLLNASDAGKKLYGIAADDVYHINEWKAMAQLAAINRLDTTVILVHRNGFTASPEEIEQSESVKESVAIDNMLDKALHSYHTNDNLDAEGNRMLVPLTGNLDLTNLPDSVVVDSETASLLEQASFIHVYNQYNDARHYEEYLDAIILKYLV